MPVGRRASARILLPRAAPPAGAATCRGAAATLRRYGGCPCEIPRACGGTLANAGWTAWRRPGPRGAGPTGSDGPGTLLASRLDGLPAPRAPAVPVGVDPGALGGWAARRPALPRREPSRPEPRPHGAPRCDGDTAGGRVTRPRGSGRTGRMAALTTAGGRRANPGSASPPVGRRWRWAAGRTRPLSPPSHWPPGWRRPIQRRWGRRPDRACQTR